MKTITIDRGTYYRVNYSGNAMIVAGSALMTDIGNMLRRGRGKISAGAGMMAGTVWCDRETISWKKYTR